MSHEIKETFGFDHPIPSADKMCIRDRDGLNQTIYGEIHGWTVGELRNWLLCETTTEAAIRRISKGLTAEMVAAVTKLMSNLDLVYACLLYTSRCV